MRIVNLSYVSIKEFEDPESWLKRINYFTGILEQVSHYATVINFHSIQFNGIVARNGVEYHFKPLSLFQRWFPFSFHSYILGLMPDVIIVHGLLFPWQVLLLQRRLNRNTRLFVQHHAERPLKGIKKLLQRKADKAVLGYFFSSTELGLEWVRQGLISHPGKLHEVMEVSSVFLPVDRKEARIHTKISGQVIYLWVGDLTTNKDPITAIKSFKKLLAINATAELYMIYKSTELLDQIKALFQDSPDLREKIHLIGEIPHDEMVYWFSSVDFIISTSHYEGSGTAVCEAMSCGCIPILSNIPSFRMMTGNGECGFLFPPGDSDTLAEILEKSLDFDRESLRARVRGQFHSVLSFEAIAGKIVQVVLQPNRT